MTTANVNVTKVLLKRGNTVQNNNYTGVSGEITIDTQLKTLRVHDGVTAGGNAITALGAIGSYSNTNTAAYLASQSITSANIGAFQTFANANAATQTTEINSLRANMTAANTAITNLTSNAAIQATLLDTLTGNAATQSQVLDTLTSNAAAQATSLTTLLSNAVAQQTSLIDLVANAATQAQAIASVTGTYSNANVATYLSVFDGNILPSANVTYSLGSETRQWRDLWVSNNTIYIGNTPIRVDGGTLLVNGAPVSGGSTYGNANVAAYLPTYTGNIAANIVKNGNVWTFGTDGTTTFPTNISLGYGGNSVQFPRIIAPSGKAVSLQGQGSTGSAALAWSVDHDADTKYAAVGVSQGGGDNLAKVILTAGNTTPTLKVWKFDETGTTTLPTVLAGDTSIGTAFNTNPPGHTVTLKHNGGVSGGSGGELKFDYGNAQIKVVKDAGTTQTWTFGTDGTTQFPGSKILAPVSESITMQSDQYSQLMWENANLTVAPNMAINSNFYVSQNNATLDIAKRDGSGTQVTKSWYWNADGTTTLPAGGTITEGGGLTGAIKLTPAGGANANQALLIYPTAAGDGDHVHLTAGGGSTELYLGNDFHYVKLVDGGNIELRSATANLSAQASWNFDTTGNIDARQTLGIKVPDGVPTDVAVINSTSGSWEMNPNLSLATTGGSGSGLTVNVAEEGGYASTIEIATAGTGYTNGDLITVTSGTSNATFTIVIAGRNSWQFGGDGNLTLPSANFDASPAPSSSPSIVFPSEGYIGASLETEAEKFLIKSEGKTWTFDGSYEDLTFPGGTVFSSQNIVVVANANLTVTTFDGTSHYTTFESDGNLRLPETGYLRVGTGIVAGFASSPAPIISGFSSISAENFRFQGNGVNILSAVGGTYGNTQVAEYLANFDGTINFTASPATINTGEITAANVSSTNGYFYGNGLNILSNIASESYVTTQINNLVNNAPALLDTLGEIAANLATEANATGSILNSIANTNANVAAANVNISALQSNAGTQQTSIDLLSSRVDQAVNITSSPQFAGLTTTANVNMTANVRIHQDLVVDGNINFIGNVTQTNITTANAVFTGDTYGFGALYAGVLGYTPLPYTVIQATADYNDYSQINFQNLNLSANASTEWVATAGNGTDLTNYIDFGIAGGAWDGTQLNSVGTAAKANDGWIYIQGNATAGTGGNLVVGTIQPGKRVNILTGGPGSANIYSYFNSTGLTTANVYAANYLYANGVSILTGIGGTYSNVNVEAYIGGNIGAYQTFANTNAATQATSINSINANIGAYQTFANANVSSIQNQIFASNANIGAFQTYANATFGVSSYGNTQVAAYLLTYPNVNAATLNTTSGNITTLRAANFNSANAVISGGYISALTNVTVTTGNTGSWYATTLNATNGNITTLAATNFSTANAVVTGGYATGLANITVTGNATVGNLIGTSPNTTIIAGSYTSTFDNVGNVILPNVYVTGNSTVAGIAPGYAPNRPAFRVYGTVGTQIVAPTTVSSTHGVAVDYNQGSYYNNTTGIFTAPVTGLYHAYATLRVGSNNGLNQATIVKNNSTSGANVIAFWETDTNTGSAMHFSMTGYAQLVAGDTLRLQVLSGNINLDTNDSWGITYIG